MSSFVINSQTPHRDLDREPVPEQLSESSRDRHWGKVRKQSTEFLRGPIPLPWLCRASRLTSRASLIVGLTLWFRSACLKRMDGLTIGTKLLSRFGLARQAFYRGLRDLEADGLITVDRLPGRSSRISIRAVKLADQLIDRSEESESLLPGTIQGTDCNRCTSPRFGADNC
jgi:DNA-binding transcriptional ArsR family regulator